MPDTTRGRCETCVHWSDDWDGYPPEGPQLLDDDGEDMYVNREDYEPVVAPGRWGHCKLAGRFGPRQNERFFVVDGSEYKADLYTRSDFGCTEHEPKP